MIAGYLRVAKTSLEMVCKMLPAGECWGGLYSLWVL